MAAKWVLAVTVAVLAGVSPAYCGWITIKNETDHIVVLQEQATVNGRVVKGRTLRVMPGETLKEFQAKPGERTICISTLVGAQPATATYKWGEKDAAFAVTKGATGYALGAPVEKASRK